jgi:hypothetical protein
MCELDNKSKEEQLNAWSKDTNGVLIGDLIFNHFYGKDGDI